MTESTQPEPKYKLHQVYGTNREVPLTYHARTYVDDEFSNILNREKHIVIYGGSRQGKTCLRKRVLAEDSYVTIQCSKSTTRQKIYEMLLKQAGAAVDVSESLTVTGHRKLSITFEGTGDGIVPVFSGAPGGSPTEPPRDVVRHSFEVDATDPNDVIHALEGVEFRKLIVLEDFHYLDEDVQRELAFDLKAFHEKSKLSFIVVGVWKEADRLILYNGDLLRRLENINADRWDVADLGMVVANGERLLNISIHEDTVTFLINQCQANVGLLQELCHKLCERENVLETFDVLHVVGAMESARAVVNELAEASAARYSNALREMAGGYQSNKSDMYRWILEEITRASERELKRGIPGGTIHQRIAKRHPKADGDRVHFSSVEAKLRMLAKLQQHKNIKPYIVDYDPVHRSLTVVDSEFILWVLSRPADELQRTIWPSDEPVA